MSEEIYGSESLGLHTTLVRIKELQAQNSRLLAENEKLHKHILNLQNQLTECRDEVKLLTEALERK